jgi:hypothetical protein
LIDLEIANKKESGGSKDMSTMDEYEQPMLNNAARRVIMERDQLVRRMRRATSMLEMSPLLRRLSQLNRLLGMDANARFNLRDDEEMAQRPSDPVRDATLRMIRGGARR